MRLGIEDNKHDTTTSPAPHPVIMHHDQATAYLDGLNESYTDYALQGEWVTIGRSADNALHLKAAELPPQRMPDLAGMNITDATYLLENMGAKVSFSGQGTVKEQSVQPGDTLKANSVINLILAKQ